MAYGHNVRKTSARPSWSSTTRAHADIWKGRDYRAFAVNHARCALPLVTLPDVMPGRPSYRPNSKRRKASFDVLAVISAIAADDYEIRKLSPVFPIVA